MLIGLLKAVHNWRRRIGNYTSVGPLKQTKPESPHTAPCAEYSCPRPEIWKGMDDFRTRLAKFGNDAKAAEASVKRILRTVFTSCI